MSIRYYTLQLCTSFFVIDLIGRLVRHHAELHEGDDGEKALSVQVQVMTEAVAHTSELLYLAVDTLMTGVGAFMSASLRLSAPRSVRRDEDLLAAVVGVGGVTSVGEDGLVVLQLVVEAATEDGLIGPQTRTPRAAHPGDKTGLERRPELVAEPGAVGLVQVPPWVLLVGLLDDGVKAVDVESRKPRPFIIIPVI